MKRERERERDTECGERERKIGKEILKEERERESD